MSQENLEIVRAGYDLLLQGDLDAFEDWITPDVVIVQPPEVPDAKTYEGPAAVAKAWQDWPDQWEDFRLDLIDLTDVDDDVVVSETRHRGRGRESGIEMNLPMDSASFFQRSLIFRIAVPASGCAGNFSTNSS